MSFFSNKLTSKILEHWQKKEDLDERRKKYDLNHFECNNPSFLFIYIAGIIFFSALIVVVIVTNSSNLKDVVATIYVFGLFIAFFSFVAWASEHQKMIVDGDDIEYINVWGIKKRFKFSEITKCLASEQLIRLYVDNRRVATLDIDMYGVDFFITRCNSEGIYFEPKRKNCISKFTLVWNATRYIAWVFIWLAVAFTIIVVPVELASEPNLVKILEIEAVLIAGLVLITLMYMLYMTIGLIEVIKIEKGLGIKFNEEMNQRGAIGSEYQDEEWFVESIPGKIEVLNRRFIKEWCGIKKEENSEATLYHVEFIDIHDKKHKIGGHYKKYAQEMHQWYKRKP